MLRLNENEQGVTLAVRVQTRARRNALIGEIDGALKIALTAPPVDGRANAACVDLLAALLNVPRASISIISGQTSRNKVVRLQGISTAEARSRLEVRQARS